jgi:hypothetical protein
MGSPLQATGKILGLVPGVTPPDKLDKILRRLADTGIGPAMTAAAQSRNPKMSTKALDVLLARGGERALRQVDDFLGDHRLTLGRPIGGGMESVVFAARPRIGPDQHVVKIAVRDQMHVPRQAFDLPDIPGVAHYWAKDSMGPLSVAVQPRAQVMRDVPPELADQAIAAVDRLDDSLRSRGQFWDDSMFGNMGLLDDDLVVIDGTFKPMPDYQTPGTYATPEEAIRALRVRPDERQLFFDGP